MRNRTINITQEQMIQEVREASIKELQKFTKLINELRADLKGSNLEKTAEASIGVCVIKNFMEKDYLKKCQQLMLSANEITH